ncbi:hypothetical protein MY10362_004427 [Beauveria mimosiformis]
MSSSNLPRQEAHQQPASIARIKRNVKTVAELVSQFKQAKVASFDQQQLRDNHGISVQKLDIVTGKPDTHGQAYIEPVQPEVVTEWLKKYAPEESEDRPFFEIDFVNLDVTGLSTSIYFGEAMDLCTLLLNHVRYSKHENTGVMMGQESNWNEAE